MLGLQMTMLRMWLLTLLAVVAAASGSAAAGRGDDFLPPEEVFHPAVTATADELRVTWRIDPGHYLYRHRLGFSSEDPAIELGEVRYPPGTPHEDEFFGPQEIYRGTAEFVIPYRRTGGTTAARAVTLQLKWQGCADAGLCYPPTTWPAMARLPAASLPAASPPTASLLGAQPAAVPGQDDFLPPDAAFRFSAVMRRPDAVELTWAIADDYYLYRHRIGVTSDTAGIQLGAVSLPAGEPHTDEFFGESRVFYGLLEALVPVARPAGNGGELELKVTYQGCANAGLCYLPVTKTVRLDMPAATAATAVDAQALDALAEPVSEQDRLAALVRDGNLFAMLAVCFGIGILLSLTPCVLPMIPILSGIIAGQGERASTTRSFSLAFTYVQGMALTYAAAGATFAVLFKQAPQATFQQPWIIGVFAAIFVALSLAMFGAFNLQMPAALQTRLTEYSNRQQAGTYVGTFAMGALSSLIVTACVAPVIVAALSVIVQTGDLARGAGALYATGLGMGVPLLIVGASAGSLLPRVGPWMETVKSLFGVMFLGVAVYLLGPVLPASLSLLLWSALAVVSGFWVFSLRARDGGPAPAAVRGFGLLAVFYGLILLLGAAAGGSDPLQPLKGTFLARDGETAVRGATELAMRRIKSAADLDRELAAASAAGRPVMLDFYADWCVSCKEMEKYTFPDPAVQAALSDAVLLQADVTANDATDQVLLQRFGVFGPPTIAFFTADGQERANYRLVGFVPAERFSEHVRAAFTPAG